MLVEQTDSNDLGPFFGAEVFDDNGPTVRLGMLGVDATTGDVLYGDSATGLAETGSTVGFGSWNRSVMDFDFDAHYYTVRVNGTRLLTTDFETSTDCLTNVDLSALAASVTGDNLTGIAYFDNFTSCESNITLFAVCPEPDNWVQLIGGSAALFAMRKRRSAEACSS